MARPLRIEFPGAVYHVTSRGDRCEAIYEDDEDRERFLGILGDVIDACHWICHAYCLMNNHYHLVVETPDGNLSRGMRQLNGVYTQYFNRRHQQSGHVFQGRYKSILVDGGSYLLELSRYVVLNPVRAGLVESAADWRWSSYRPMVGKAERPTWLAVESLLEQFADTRVKAVRRYRRFVAAGGEAKGIWQNLNRQIYLGDDEFVARMQQKLGREQSEDVNIPVAQRRTPQLPLERVVDQFGDRDRAIVAAYETGQYSYQEIAGHYGLHFTTVGRIVRAARKERH